jgi:hypothetical protein
METSAGLDFMGSFSDKRRLSCKAYGYPNFEHNRGGGQFAPLSCIWRQNMWAAFFFRRPKEPNSTVERYSDGRGMSFGLEDQKPQPQAPQPLLGLFFPAVLLLSPLGSRH